MSAIPWRNLAKANDGGSTRWRRVTGDLKVSRIRLSQEAFPNAEGHPAAVVRPV